MEPITRTEKLMAGKQLEPITRKELFLAKAAGMDVKTPEPITREEMFLNMITGGGGTPGGGGGSSASVPWNDVTFIDYDGTVLHSYTLEEAQALTELPPLPERKGLICQGWNWSLEDIKAQGKVIVGAMYITDDGKTRIYIHLTEGRTSPMLGVAVNGSVTVDWGDGTEPDVLTGTNTSTRVWTPTHNYASAGDYVISLSVDGEIKISGSEISCSYLLRHSTTNSITDYLYADAVQKIEIGEGVNLANGSFYSFRSLKSVVISDCTTITSDYHFGNCCSVEAIVFPKNLSGFGAYACSSCRSLKYVSIPNGIKGTFATVFINCSSIKTINIPNGITEVSNRLFYQCYMLEKIFIPNSVTKIGNYSFYNCPNMRCYDFSAHTSVPTLDNKDAFYAIPSGCRFLIPAALYDEWKAATNWATYASYMVAV